MKLKVMLIDDEPFILQGLTLLIDWEKEGCEIVRTAANGMEALDYLKEHTVDLILADIEMPVMTGLELLEKIRVENISDAYFAILSGYNDFSYAQKAIRCSCMEYILKPVSRDSLLALIRKVAKQKELTDREEEKKKTLQRSYLIRNLAALMHGKTQEGVLENVREQLPFSSGVRYVQILLDGMENLEELEDQELRGLRNRMIENCRLFLDRDREYCIKDIFGNEDELSLIHI